MEDGSATPIRLLFTIVQSKAGEGWDWMDGKLVWFMREINEENGGT